MKLVDIISYNIELGRKLSDVVSWIEQAELYPDVFCFQEFPEDKREYFRDFLNERGYGFDYTPSIILSGIQLGELTAFRKSTLKLLDSEHVELGNYRWERRHPSLRGQRSALITHFKYGKTDFTVANVHLSVLSPHSMRYKQLAMVIDELQSFSENALILGDFNYTNLFGVNRLFTFMKSYGFTCVGKRMITHKIFKRIPQQLDYVFQKGFTPQEIQVHKVPHSDHLPVAVSLTLA